MPTYDYKCKACNHRWELFQSMTAKPEKSCPACGKKSAERLIGTGAALLFKGSGFYQTDYRSESYKSAAKADAAPAAEGTKPPASATPAAPAAAAAAPSAAPAGGSKPKARASKAGTQP